MQILLELHIDHNFAHFIFLFLILFYYNIAHSSSSASGSYPSGGLIRQDSNLDGSPLPAGAGGGLGASGPLSTDDSHGLQQRVSAAASLSSSGVGPLLTSHLHGLSITPAFSTAAGSHSLEQQQALGYSSGPSVSSAGGPPGTPGSTSGVHFTTAGGATLQRHQQSSPQAHEVVLMKREGV